MAYPGENFSNKLDMLTSVIKELSSSYANRTEIKQSILIAKQFNEVLNKTGNFSSLELKKVIDNAEDLLNAIENADSELINSEHTKSNKE